jgi:opacity protein-like surface antigen
MKKYLAAAAAALFACTAAQAQDVTAPDGSPAFGLEPYFGVFGGYHDFDTGNRGSLQLGNSANGWLAGGYAGVNIPLAGFVVGAEGSVAKGFNDIDYEYGATGHLGARVGDSGMIFARAGYHWVEAKRGFRDDRNEIYGFGVEVGPRDIGLGGLTGNSGVRLRFAVDTFDEFQSIRPTVGATFHF